MRATAVPVTSHDTACCKPKLTTLSSFASSFRAGLNAPVAHDARDSRLPADRITLASPKHASRTSRMRSAAVAADLERLGARPGDILKITGRTVAVARAHVSDAAHDGLIQIDGTVRSNCGAGLQEHVTASPVESAQASRSAWRRSGRCRAGDHRDGTHARGSSAYRSFKAAPSASRPSPKP